MLVNNILKNNVELYFLGDRDYVQAPLLLEFAFCFICIDDNIKNLNRYHLVRFKQTDEVCRPVRLIPRDKLTSGDTIKSQIDIKYDGQLKRYCLVPAAGNVELRLPASTYTLFDVSMDIGELLQATAKVPSTTSFWHLLSEVVELTKRLHQSKYNNQSEQFRFVVGGFEKMDFFSVKNDMDVLINSKVVNHFRHGGDIYNQTLISVSQGDEVHRFYLPFIGEAVL